MLSFRFFTELRLFDTVYRQTSVFLVGKEMAQSTKLLNSMGLIYKNGKKLTEINE